MATQIQLRRGTSLEWEVNPILAEGEIGIDLTLDAFKIGDGSHTWAQLAFGSNLMLTADNSIHGSKLVDNSITADKLSPELRSSLGGNDDVIGGPSGESEAEWVLPEFDGESGQSLVTDGFGRLE